MYKFQSKNKYNKIIYLVIYETKPQRVKMLVAQRDQATSKLLAAQLKIIELTNKINRMLDSEKEL